MKYSFFKAQDSSKNSLKHHGIRGQKWGVKNGPPYPLKPEAHSKSEVRAGWQKSVKSIDKTTTGLPSPKRVKTANYHDREVGIALNAHNDQTEYESRTFTNTGRSELFKPATVIKEWEAELGKNPYQLDSEDFSMAAKNANPGYGERGTTNNCTRCAAAVQLRNMGYDVIAARSDKGASAFEYETWFNGARTKGYSSSDDLMKDILKQGEGASGVLNGYFGAGLGSGSGGHALHWSVKDRRVEIHDGQNGETISGFTEAWKRYGFNDGACFATRLDNTTPNWQAMEQDSVFGVNNSARRIKW